MENSLKEFSFQYLENETHIPKKIKTKISRKIKALLYTQERADRNGSYNTSKAIINNNDCHSTACFLLEQSGIDLYDGTWKEGDIVDIIKEKNFPYYLCIAEYQGNKYTPAHSISIIGETEGYIIYFEQNGSGGIITFSTSHIKDFQTPPKGIKPYWKSKKDPSD